MITYKRCDQVDDKLIYDTFKEGFSDYIVKFNMTYEYFINRFFNVDGNDRRYSHIALNGDVGIGVIFGGVNTFDGIKSMRCGALSVAPEYRGKGVAQELVKLHKQKAKELDCKQLVLEVIVGNDRAIRFYEKNEYIKKNDWFIYTTDNLSFLDGVDSSNVKQITIDDVRKYRYENIDYHIAWSNEIFCVEKRDAYHYGVFDGNKLVGVISTIGGAVLFIHVLEPYRNKGYGKALIKKAIKEDVESISTFFSAQSDLEQFLVKNGFVKDKISQYEMAIANL